MDKKTMMIEIQRTGRTINLISRLNPYCRDAFQVSDEHGYHRIPVLDIENYNEIQWDGIEFNRLLLKDGKVFRFNGWIGEYPFGGIVIEEIGKAILTGGTCQIPYIRQRFLEEFKITPENVENLRLVASGAARVAQMKNAEENLNLESVLAHSLGVAIMNLDKKLVFDKLLAKGTPYPCEIIREYETAFDNQTRIDVNIYEAGNETESDLKFHRFRGTLTLKNIPPAPKGQTYIDVKFEYTEDQSLRVTAIDKQRSNHFERQIIEKPARIEEIFYDKRN